nr:hypothetical protein [Tanacetum cinerariifolium]
MAKGNVPAPTRTDDQLVPVKARLPIGKSNLLMDLQNKQKNPIFLISLDILENTNFLYVDLLRSALGITPKDPAHPFVAPLAVDLIIDFVNKLGYPEELQFVSKIPRHLIFQMFWGVVMGTNVDYAKLIWEEFVQEIKTFFSDAASVKVPSKKPNPHRKRYDRLVDEEDEEPQPAYEPQPASEPQIEDDEYNLQRGIQPSVVPQDDTSANVVHDTPSPADAETDADTNKSNIGADTEILDVDEEQGNDVSHTVALEERIVELDNGQAGSDHNTPSSSRTLSLMKNLDDAFTYGNPFMNDKPTKEEPGKANVEIKVESIVIVPIRQASLSVPPLFILVIDIAPPKPVSVLVQEPVLTATTAITTTFPPPPPPLQQQSTTDHKLANLIDNYINETVKEVIQNALQAPVHDRFRELSEFKMKEILRDRMFENGSYRSQPEHAALYEALEASMDCENEEEFIEKMANLKLRRPQHGRLLTQEKLPPAPLSKRLPLDLKSMLMHLPIRIKIRKKTSYFGKLEIWAPSSNGIVDRLGSRSSTKLIWKIDLANLEGYQVVPNMSKPLPLGGPPGQVIIQPQYFLNKDLKYLVSGNKERRNALSISKLKATYYLEFWLEELVPSLWIKSECEYDISAANVISHMWILSVVSLKTFSRYGYTYLKEIVLRRSDYKEYKISEADFKNLHPNDFEDLYILHLQGNLNHISDADKVHLFNSVNLWIRNIVIKHHVEDLQLRIESYQTKLYLTQSSWDATDFLFKEYYTIVHKQRAIIYRDRNNQKKMTREFEVHKFRDGMLTRILEQLDHMVKDYVQFKFNPGMDHKILSEDDKRRSKKFIERYLPRDNPLVSVEVLRYDIKRSKSDNKGIVPTEMELVLEQIQQGIEKVAVSSSLRLLKPKCTIQSRAKISSINLIRTLFQCTCLSHTIKTRNILRVLRIILVVLPEHPGDT